MNEYPVFPKGFLFGAATAAYQIEGAHDSDGRGPSIWDTFSHRPGKIRNNDNGDVACSHYHRYKEDVALMKELGLGAYRLSTSWPRIFPEGTGRINRKGCDFYSYLVDELLEKNIVPFVTLYHWDLPQALQDRGGWANRDCAGWFGEYVEAVVKLFGDRVKHWITLNEPSAHAATGSLLGMHAPGKRNIFRYARTIHNLLRGHGTAVKIIRAINPGARAGITLDLRPFYPAAEGWPGKRAVRNADNTLMRPFLDSVFKGIYPAGFLRRNRLFLPRAYDEDLKLISAPVDFIGVNNYSRDRVRYIPVAGFWPDTAKFPEAEYDKNGVQYTSMGWEVYPDSLYEVLMLLKNEYSNPAVYVTENGAAYTDTPAGGRVHDPLRVDFLKKYIASLKKALDCGANCRGYFVWSFMDNFEWSLGYGKRFGLVYVDYKTQRRMIKDSGYWYRDLIAAQG